MTPTPPPSPKIHALTRGRIIATIVIAVMADVVQLLLGPFGWTFFDEIIDIIVFFIMTRLIGFHWLLLPTFLLEVVPMIDVLPTWTGCVLWVLRVRHKQATEKRELPGPGPSDEFKK